MIQQTEEVKKRCLGFKYLKALIGDILFSKEDVSNKKTSKEVSEETEFLPFPTSFEKTTLKVTTQQFQFLDLRDFFF